MHLKSSVQDFIKDAGWMIPRWLRNKSYEMDNEIRQSVIPKALAKDELIWSGSDSGSLSLKDAYKMVHMDSNHLGWPCLIWSKAVPPTKAFLTWRIMHHKAPTDENMLKRGCGIVSVCNLCWNNSESSEHLFIQCAYASKIWSWLSHMLNTQIDLSSMEAILSILQKDWQPQVKELILSGIANSIYAIWSARNASRFESKSISAETSINQIIGNISLTGNLSKLSGPISEADRSIFCRFRVKGNPPKAGSIKEVIWKAPSFNWIKLNSDGADKRTHGMAACGGIYRDQNSATLGSYALNIGLS